jgi:hypothetical protein
LIIAIIQKRTTRTARGDNLIQTIGGIDVGESLGYGKNIGAIRNALTGHLVGLGIVKILNWHGLSIDINDSLFTL